MQLPYEANQTNFKAVEDCKQFDNVEAPLTAFILRDVGLRLAKRCSKISLGYLSADARIAQHGPQADIVLRVMPAGHVPGLS